MDFETLLNQPAEPYQNAYWHTIRIKSLDPGSPYEKDLDFNWQEGLGGQCVEWEPAWLKYRLFPESDPCL